MADQNVLDFRAQAEQMMRIIESKLDDGQTGIATELLILKFKAMYEQGVIAGKAWAEEGTYPYTPI